MAIFLYAIFVFSQFFLIKMELASLCRETALLHSRVQKTDNSRDNANILKNIVLTTARQRGSKLKSDCLNVSRKPFDNFTFEASSDGSLGKLVKSTVSSVSQSLAGNMLTLTYTVPVSRPFRLFFPDGITLEESLAYKNDPWKEPVKRIAQWFLGD